MLVALTLLVLVAGEWGAQGVYVVVTWSIGLAASWLLWVIWRADRRAAHEERLAEGRRIVERARTEGRAS